MRLKNLLKDRNIFRKILSCYVILLLMAISFSAIFINSAEAYGGGPNVIVVMPTSQNVTVGDSFYTLINITVNWEIDNVTLSNITFENAGILNYTDTSIENLFSGGDWWTPDDNGTIDNSSGYAFNLTWINSSGINQTYGYLANITWYANNVGTAYVNITGLTKNNSGNTYITNIQNATVIVHPKGPSSLSVSTVNDSLINLTFLGIGNSGLDNITIRRNTGSYPILETGTEIYNGTGSNYIDSGLNYNTNYYYRAWGWNQTYGLYSLLQDMEIVQNTNLTWPYVNTTIKGYVNDSNGDPISNVVVNATNLTQHGLINSNISNATGYYELNVFESIVNLSFIAGGYSPQFVDFYVPINETVWHNQTLTSPGGPPPGPGGSYFLSDYQSSVTPAYIVNNTMQKFNFSLVKEMGENLFLDNLTITFPTYFSYIGNNGTSLGNPNEYTVSNTSNSITWLEDGGSGFQFNSTEYFWFNASSTASLGSGTFNISAINHNGGDQQNLTINVYTTETFYFTGSIHNNTGQILPGGVAEITVQGMSFDGPPTTLGNFNDTSDANGEFNITGIPICQNYSQISCEGPMGPGSSGTLFYQLAAYEYNDSTNTYAINTSRTLPLLPATELKCMLNNPEFYLIPAISFNVTAVGPQYNYSNFPPVLEGYSSKTFELMVKDQSLGFSVKEFSTHASQRIFSVPAGRNYSLSLFPQMSFPISVSFNNISWYCENQGGDFGIDGVTTSCVAYNGTYLVNVEVNTTSVARNLTGNFTDITNPDSMRIVAYTMETDDMVFENWALPFNLGYDEGWKQYNDTYNLLACNFSIALPATEAPSYIMLRAYAHNTSGYYMGSNIINASNGNLNVSSINFTMEPLINGTIRSISANNVSDQWNSTNIVNTTAVLFKLVNTNGTHLSSVNAFIEVKRELDGTEYMTMMDAENGQFNISLVNGSSIDKLTLYSQQYASISAPVSAAILNGSTTNSFFNCTDGICNITMRSFGDFDPLGENSSIIMDMYLSNSSCNIPNPPEVYSLIGSQGKDDFSPLSAILKGDVNLMISTNNVSIYYINVDLLASGPPDAAFTDSGSESGLASLWKFGSQGPDIYEEVIIGINYSGTLFENHDTIIIDIPILYDNEFNEVWNRTNGDTLDDISNNLSDYADYLDSPYEAYLNGTGVVCDENDPTLANGLAYRDVQNTTIWMKIPHFSGLGGEISSNEPSVSNENPTNESTGVAISLSKLSVTIEDPNGDALNWSIETKPDIGNQNNLSSAEGNGTKNCSVTGLQLGTTYIWFVNATDNTSWTNETYLFTTNFLPNNPTGVTPANGTLFVDAQPTINVTVSDPDGQSMTVYFYENTTGSWLLQQTNNSVANNTNVVWPNYANANVNKTKYWWSVNITDGTNWTNNTYFFTTEIIPSAPLNFTATKDGTSAIDISWTKNNSADKTYIEYKSSATWTRGSGTEVYNDTGSSTTHSSLSSGTIYYYQAWSFNNSNNSWSLSYASDSATTDSSTGDDDDDDDDTGDDDDDDTGDDDDDTTSAKDDVETLFDITLDENFTASDSDGDGEIEIDEFNDPNGLLTATRSVNISGSSNLLISVDGSDDLLLWDPSSNSTNKVTQDEGTVTKTETDTTNESITLTVQVNKSDWIYIEITDQYPDITNLTVKRSDGTSVPTSQIWRENGKIYVLDDPDTTYTFEYIYTILEPIFSPESETTFTDAKPTISITYNESVNVTLVTFGNKEITLITNDNMTFTYTPTENLIDGTYTLSITVEDINSNIRTDNATYTIDLSSGKTKCEYKEDNLLITALIVIIVIIVIIIGIIAILFKTGYLYIEDQKIEIKKKKK